MIEFIKYRPQRSPLAYVPFLEEKETFLIVPLSCTSSIPVQNESFRSAQLPRDDVKRLGVSKITFPVPVGFPMRQCCGLTRCYARFTAHVSKGKVSYPKLPLDKHAHGNAVAHLTRVIHASLCNIHFMRIYIYLSLRKYYPR